MVASPDATSWRTAACSRARSELVSRETRTPSAAHDSSSVMKLLGERLGGSHQRSLPPGFDCAQKRIQRDDGLAGSDLALE